MRTNLSCATVTAIVVLATLVLPYAVAAQSIWSDGQSGNELVLEFYKPQFKSEEGWEFSGLSVFLTYPLPVSERWAIVVELPYAHGRYGYSYSDPYWGDYSYRDLDDVLGNPYIGLHSRGEKSRFQFELGARIPVVGEEEFPADWAGLFADFDRCEAFLQKAVTVQGAVNLRAESQDGFLSRVRFGPYLWIWTDRPRFFYGTGGDTELLLHYSAQLGYRERRLALLAGVSGVSILTEDQLLYDDNSVHQLGFQAAFTVDNITPGFHLRIPLDDELDDVYRLVWGFSLEYHFD